MIDSVLKERTDETIRRIEITAHEVSNLRRELEKERAIKHEAQKRFEHTFFHSPIAMAIVAPDGTWIEANDQLCDLVGYSREELKKMKFQDITRKEDIEPDVKLVKKMLNDTIKSYKLAKAYVKKGNGEEVWVGLYVTLIRTPMGQPIYFVRQIVSEDVAKEVLGWINATRAE